METQNKRHYPQTVAPTLGGRLTDIEVRIDAVLAETAAEPVEQPLVLPEGVTLESIHAGIHQQIAVIHREWRHRIMLGRREVTVQRYL